MSVPTPPLLFIATDMQPGDVYVVPAYQGIRVSIDPVGGSFSYSFVNDANAEIHDAPTEVSVDVFTTIDVVWPWVRISCDSGTGRAAVV